MSALFQPRHALKVCAWFIFYFSASMQLLLLFTRLLLKTGGVQEFGGRSGVKTFDWHAICSYQASLDLRDFQVDLSLGMLSWILWRSPLNQVLQFSYIP